MLQICKYLVHNLLPPKLRRSTAAESQTPLFRRYTVPAPLALHQVVSVAVGGEVVIRLMGYDLDGDDLVATISSVPDSGTLHQASRCATLTGVDYL